MVLYWIIIKKRFLHIYLATQKYKWQHLHQMFTSFFLATQSCTRVHQNGSLKYGSCMWVCVCVFSKSHKARVNLLSLLFALLLSCSIKPRTSVKSRNVGDREKCQRLAYFQQKMKVSSRPHKDTGARSELSSAQLSSLFSETASPNDERGPSVDPKLTFLSRRRLKPSRACSSSAVNELITAIRAYTS